MFGTVQYVVSMNIPRLPRIHEYIHEYIHIHEYGFEAYSRKYSYSWIRVKGVFMKYSYSWIRGTKSVNVKLWSFGKILASPWRIPAEIPAGIDYFPLAPSLRVAGSPHLVLSHRIFLNNLSASVGILGRPNSRSLAAGASPGTPKHINKGARRDAGWTSSKGINNRNVNIQKTQ
jgi:hypothetical protein